MKIVALFLLMFGSSVFGQNIMDKSLNKYFKVSDTLSRYEFRLYISKYIRGQDELYQIQRLNGEWKGQLVILDHNLNIIDKRKLKFKNGDEFWLNLYRLKMNSLEGINYVNRKLEDKYKYFVNDKENLFVVAMETADTYTDNDYYSTYFSSDKQFHRISMAIPQTYLKEHPDVYEIIMFNKFLDIFEKEFGVKLD